MSRLDIMTPSHAQTVIDGLYRDVERRIAASPPGLCPVDLAKSFLDLCHAQTCGKCVPCRIGLGQLSELMEQVLEGEATMETISIIERVARVIVNSADCAIGRDAARLVLDGVQGFRDDYEEHILRHRCLGGMREPVPCVALCPAGVDIPGYLVLIKYGRYADAVRLIRKDNPFPSACAYICEHPCEARCRRNMIDDAVNIRGLKRYAVDNAGYVPQPDCAEPTGKKVAVIGGGPAGLSCAYYLAEKGYRPTVFEREARPGGMLMNGIPSFRLEKDVVEAEIDILRELGVEFRCGVEVGKDVTIAQLREQGYQSFYVAVGLQSGGKLNIPGGDADGVMAGIDFMRQVNLHEKKTLSGKVVVIGGGNIGADVARTAVRCGAESVDLYCLEAYDDMPMGEEDRSECERDGITVHAGWGQTEIVVEDGKCAGIRFRKCTRVKNGEGRFAPEFDDSVSEQAECTTVLYCIGQKVDWRELLTGTAVEFNPNGTVKADPVTYQTAEKDIFVGGDAYTGQKFAIDAIAAGKEGAISLHRFVKHATLTVGRNRRQFIELDKENALIPVNYDTTPRQRIGYNEALRRTFSDERVAFTEEQIKKETARCLSCGASIVDPNKCIGCGVCTTKCAFDAIHLHRERPECSKMYTCEDKMKAILPYMIKREFKIKRAARKSK